jgi:hypothetical protein
MRIEEQYIGGVLFKNHIMEESDMSTEQQKNNWLTTCQSCDKYGVDKCNECNCLLVTIMAISTSRCPLNKW